MRETGEGIPVLGSNYTYFMLFKRLALQQYRRSQRNHLFNQRGMVTLVLRTSRMRVNEGDRITLLCNSPHKKYLVRNSHGLCDFLHTEWQRNSAPYHDALVGRLIDSRLVASCPSQENVREVSGSVVLGDIVRLRDLVGRMVARPQNLLVNWSVTPQYTSHERSAMNRTFLSQFPMVSLPKSLVDTPAAKEQKQPEWWWCVFILDDDCKLIKHHNPIEPWLGFYDVTRYHQGRMDNVWVAQVRQNRSYSRLADIMRDSRSLVPLHLCDEYRQFLESPMGQRLQRITQ